MPSVAPQATISPTLLLPQDRIARQPLSSWAARLSASLGEHLGAIRRPRVLAERIGAVANNGALIAAYLGDDAEARALCTAQMQWQLRFSRRAGDPAMCTLAIQPWVNLGRLDALAGEWKTAIARFRVLEAYRTEGTVRLGSACLEAGGWAVVSRTREEFDRLLAIGYAVDSLKALLLARRYGETLEMCERLDRAGPPASTFGAEARVVALCGLGQPGHARARAAAAARETTGWECAVFHLRAAEADAVASGAGAARDALRRLAATVLAASSKARRTLPGMYVTLRLAATCAEARLDNEAFDVARDVWEGARAGNDEVLALESLRLRARAAPEEEREGWEHALGEAEAATEYRRYRRGSSAMRTPETARLFASLHDVFAS
jgi:hypothetical protein